MVNDCDSSEWHLLLVGSVGEMASMKQRKLWKTGEDGLVLLQQCHPNSAGSLVIARRTD